MPIYQSMNKSINRINELEMILSIFLGVKTFINDLLPFKYSLLTNSLSHMLQRAISAFGPLALCYEITKQNEAQEKNEEKFLPSFLQEKTFKVTYSANNTEGTGRIVQRPLLSTFFNPQDVVNKIQNWSRDVELFSNFWT